MNTLFKSISSMVAVTVVASALLPSGGANAQPGPPAHVPIVSAASLVPEPFQFGTSSTGFSGTGTEINIVTVPAGKLLVVEYASVTIHGIGSGGLSSVTLQTGAVSGSAVYNQLACNQIGSGSYACAGPTKQYVLAGERLTFSFATSADIGGSFRFFVSGYYAHSP